jgi:hypothetical protein
MARSGGSVDSSTQNTLPQIKNTAVFFSLVVVPAPLSATHSASPLNSP